MKTNINASRVRHGPPASAENPAVGRRNRRPSTRPVSPRRALSPAFHLLRIARHTIVPAAALILCGCAGLQTIYLERDPITTGHRMGANGFGGVGLVSGPSSYGDPISKDNLLKHWGEPDEIVRRGSREDWMYTQTRWTGFSVILVYRLPVWLPIGDGGATLTFEQDTFVEGWDEVMKARIHIVSLTGLPLTEEMTPGEFWYSGPQSGGGGKSYGGGTSFRHPFLTEEERTRLIAKYRDK